jgi:uridine kinase
LTTGVIIVFIETPLDISLARRIIRDYKEATVDEIMDELSSYLVRSRRCFTEHNENLKSSDLIVDGSLAIDNIINTIKNNINLYKVQPSMAERGSAGLGTAYKKAFT